MLSEQTVRMHDFHHLGTGGDGERLRRLGALVEAAEHVDTVARLERAPERVLGCDRNGDLAALACHLAQCRSRDEVTLGQREPEHAISGCAGDRRPDQPIEHRVRGLDPGGPHVTGDEDVVRGQVSRGGVHQDGVVGAGRQPEPADDRERDQQETNHKPRVQLR